MKRREFITLLSSAAAWPVAAHAQQPAMPVIGFLHIASPEAYVHVVAGLRRGLAESDFVEGRNVTVEYRWGRGQLDRMPSLLADLLHHQVSVIVASLQGAQPCRYIPTAWRLCRSHSQRRQARRFARGSAE